MKNINEINTQCNGATNNNSVVVHGSAPPATYPDSLALPG